MISFCLVHVMCNNFNCACPGTETPECNYDSNALYLTDLIESGEIQNVGCILKILILYAFKKTFLVRPVLWRK